MRHLGGGATGVLGQTITAQGAQLGANTANQISQNQISAGNASASAYANTGAEINNGLSNGLSSYLRYGTGGGGAGSSGSGSEVRSWNYPGVVPYAGER